MCILGCKHGVLVHTGKTKGNEIGNSFGMHRRSILWAVRTSALWLLVFEICGIWGVLEADSLYIIIKSRVALAH